MPTVGILRDPLFEALGRSYTEDEFQELCFEFGIELDDVEEEEDAGTKTRGAASGEKVVTYKIEVPANRYDILCLEGMKRALRVFVGLDSPPTYTLSPPEPQLRITVEPPTAGIRPYVLCAVLRGCTLGQRAYNSFLDLQDRLHHNIARRRTLVAIGTHDLDKLSPPFRYTARPPKDIRFVPLAQETEFDAEELFAFYNDPTRNSPLKKFLPILAGASHYPVLYDSQDRVLSLPPIINGEHSRISPETQNVFIECTCTDLTKGKQVLNTIVAMFSEYASTPFAVEPVAVEYPAGPSHPKLAGQTVCTPDLSERVVSAGVGYIQRAVGLGAEALPAEAIPPLLRKMMLEGSLVDGGESVSVRVPITRPDVMHACDVMEDVAVAYSFNKLPRPLPPVCCMGSQQPVTKLTELMRIELAQMGFTEALSFALCSSDDCFSKLRREEGGANRAVVISNPKTEEFQVCRTSLLPGLLKTLGKNKSNPLPWKLFEAADVVLVDDESDVGASNQRRLAMVYTGADGSGFEVLHGAVERSLLMLGPKASGFSIRRGSDPAYLDGRCAEVVLPTGRVVGTFGTVHPEVLANFELEFPTSAADIDLQYFV